MKRNSLFSEELFSNDPGIDEAIRVFKSSVENHAWYHSLILAKGIDPNSIKTPADFLNGVPLLNKSKVFGSFDPTTLFKTGISNKPGSLMISSGHSGNCSFGWMKKSDELTLADETDFFLNRIFSIQANEALVINASGMGVRVFTHHTSCDTGLRSDLVIELVKRVAPDFKKLVLCTNDPHFLKKIVEEALDAGIDWNQYLVYFITGGDWFPETLRDYLHNLTGKSASNASQGYWSAIYGVTELGYPLLFETPKLALMRSNLAKNREELKKRVSFSPGYCTTPFFFHHLPDSYFTETVYYPDHLPHLVVSTLNPDRDLPLVRYDTGDLGETNIKLPDNEEFLLPVTAFWGRSGNLVESNGSQLMVNDVRELLYNDHRLAARCTGYFNLEKGGPRLKLKVQLKTGFCITREIAERFEHALQLFYPEMLETCFVGYYEMSHQMNLDFERKFNHLI